MTCLWLDLQITSAFLPDDITRSMMALLYCAKYVVQSCKWSRICKKHEPEIHEGLHLR